jgi:hypothetical protein
MKVGYDAGGGLMKDEIFSVKAFRQAQDSGSSGSKVGHSLGPEGHAESIASQNVIPRNLHTDPDGASEVSEWGRDGKSGKYLRCGAPTDIPKTLIHRGDMG